MCKPVLMVHGSPETATRQRQFHPESAAPKPRPATSARTLIQWPRSGTCASRTCPSEPWSQCTFPLMGVLGWSVLALLRWLRWTTSRS